MRESFFKCMVCSLTTSVEIDRGRIAEPTLCTNCNTNHCFTLIHNRSQFTDKQLVKLQESPGIQFFQFFFRHSIQGELFVHLESKNFQNYHRIVFSIFVLVLFLCLVACFRYYIPASFFSFELGVRQHALVTLSYVLDDITSLEKQLYRNIYFTLAITIREQKFRKIYHINISKRRSIKKILRYR